MNFIQIKETSIYVKNLESTMAFYHHKLGLEIFSFVKERHIFFKVGNSMLLCFLAKVTMKNLTTPRHYAYGQMHFAMEVTVELYEKYKTEISHKKIEIEHEQEWKFGHKSFYFRDPDLHLVEVVQKGVWE